VKSFRKCAALNASRVTHSRSKHEAVMNKDRDELIAVSPYCCPHDPLCAVHKPPHDGTYVLCSCEEAFGATRHNLSSPPPDVR
jgi:hypothetical protein